MVAMMMMMMMMINLFSAIFDQRITGGRSWKQEYHQETLLAYLSLICVTTIRSDTTTPWQH